MVVKEFEKIETIPTACLRSEKRDPTNITVLTTTSRQKTKNKKTASGLTELDVLRDEASQEVLRRVFSSSAGQKHRSPVSLIS